MQLLSYSLLVVPFINSGICLPWYLTASGSWQDAAVSVSVQDGVVREFELPQVSASASAERQPFGLQRVPFGGLFRIFI